MNFDPDYIKELVLDEIAGTIDEQSSIYLKKTISENKEALDIYRSLHQKYPPNRLLQIEQELPVNEMAVMTGIRRQQTRILWMRVTAGIAAACIIIIAGIFLFYHKPSDTGLLADSNKAKQVLLQLKGTATINLSEKNGEVKVGGAILNNTNKTLRYTSRDAGLQMATLIVPPGKDYTVILDDGTEIQLNAATNIVFPMKFSGSTREVTINGEAYLKVAKNEGKPFIVHLPNSTVQVLGTEFNVNTYEKDQVHVALVEGAVRMVADDSSVALTPGKEITYRKGEGMQVGNFNLRERLSWRKGLYFFHNSTFEEVSKILPRWFGMNIVIENMQTGMNRFTGFIDRNAPVSQSLELLKTTNAFDYSIKGDTIYIK